MKIKKGYVYIFILFMFIISIIGIIQINIINTKALSPIGNTKDNYEMITLEFGEDFDKFIQDNASLKIYEGDDGVLVNLDDLSFKIKEESPIVNRVKDITMLITEKAYKVFDGITDWIASLIS
ncbi:hypothetical protein [Clostridium chrysemydis]|uniref:hypothetical protein n=1 Tax=Clostridium chrysemydis TaxID=2665504 RepID=UPI001EE5C423|nr:hypothetical protein [Clostridium chrysemydis]